MGSNGACFAGTALHIPQSIRLQGVFRHFIEKLKGRSVLRPFHFRRFTVRPSHLTHGLPHFWHKA